MRALLRPLWNEPRAPDPPPIGRWDVLLTASFLALLAVEVAVRADLGPTTPGVLATLLLLPVLVFRRAQPLLTVALAFGATTALELWTHGGGARLPSPDSMAVMLMLPYALLRWASGREVLLGVALMAACITTNLWLEQAAASEAIGGLAVVSASMAFGATVRFRERARYQELAHARITERERIARDLHDTVAHHVSAIAIQAQAGLATAALRPQGATDALTVIAAEASRTLAEMRAMVRVLRAGEAPQLAPSPQVADLARLARPVGEGPAIEVALSGELGDLLPAVSAALYRLAQESITNARRHARNATRIVVGVTGDPAAVRLVVRDDGEPVGPRAAEAVGFGLRGMMERAALLGGTCQAGPQPERGWAVTVILPRRGPSP